MYVVIRCFEIWFEVGIIGIVRLGQICQRLGYLMVYDRHDKMKNIE
jgi:hypothetical protein